MLVAFARALCAPQLDLEASLRRVFLVLCPTAFACVELDSSWKSAGAVYVPDARTSSLAIFCSDSAGEKIKLLQLVVSANCRSTTCTARPESSLDR